MTAFGKFMHKRLPMGLKYSPYYAQDQEVMENIFHNLIDTDIYIEKWTHS